MRPEPLQPPGTDEFPFAWRDPGDASLTWEWDDMHAPSALSPLAGDYFEVMKIPVTGGRLFTPEEHLNGSVSILVSRGRRRLFGTGCRTLKGRRRNLESSS